MDSRSRYGDAALPRREEQGATGVSIKLIESEIRRFLSTSDPEVICISGRWGVGKTFAWNKFLKEAQASKGIALKRYSYVSLFGVNSLDEFKYSVFENSVKTDEIGIEPSLETLQSNTVAAAERLGRKSLWFIQQIPLVKNYLGGLGPVWFLSVSDTIICIDDIERRGKGLQIRDIMGLASSLKEHKGCKVVLILNDEQLDDDKTEFETYFEKVVDSTLKFAPTPAESARIALAGKTKAEQFLADNSVALGISNIRLIKKIERVVRKAEELLKPYDEQVFKQAAQSLALFGWSLYEKSKAPPLDYLEKRNSAEYMVARGNREVSENEAAWNALLDAYHFTNMDELDLVLLQGMTDGYFDADALRKAAAELDRNIKASRLDDSFKDAWGLFHNSFDNNEDEVLRAIRAAFDKSVEKISPINLSGTVRLFKDLGRPDEAAEIIRYYIDHHGGDKKSYDLENFPFRENVTDPDVVRAINEKFASYKDERDPKETLLGIARGWNGDELEFLANLPVDAYYDIFRNSDAETRQKAINAGLQFDRTLNTSDAMKEISRKAREALRRIGAESRINALRVAKYGVRLDDAPRAEPTVREEHGAR
jgi:hypothetical protein